MRVNVSNTRNWFPKYESAGLLHIRFFFWVIDGNRNQMLFKHLRFGGSVLNLKTAQKLFRFLSPNSKVETNAMPNSSNWSLKLGSGLRGLLGSGHFAGHNYPLEVLWGMSGRKFCENSEPKVEKQWTQKDKDKQTFDFRDSLKI